MIHDKSNPYRIALIITSLEEAGPIIFTSNLIKGLIECGSICDVFYFNEKEPTIEILARCTRIKFFSRLNFKDFDIVHSTGFIPDLYCALHRKRIIPPCVSGLHNFARQDLGQLYGKFKTDVIITLWQFALKRLNGHIYSSVQMADYYKEIFGSIVHINTRVIPYGIPPVQPKAIDKQSEELLVGLKQKYTVLCGCGVLVPRKGFSQIIDFLQHNEKFAAVIIGDGPERLRLEQQAIDLGVLDRVVFLGFRSCSSSYYPFVDIFCMTSNSEGFGLAMLEAMSFGLPIVCTDLAIYKQYIARDMVSFFDYGNLESFTQAVQSASSNRTDYSRKSKELFQTQFSLNKMATIHLDYYSTIIHLFE